MKSIPFLCGAAIVTLLATSTHAAIVYDLSTAQISGGSQNTWAASNNFASGQNGTFSGTPPTNLKFTSGSTTPGGFDYFLGTFSSTTIANAGDTLTLNFTVTTNNVSSTVAGQALRFGLFNVGSATTGSHTPTANSFNAATGYRVDYGPTNYAADGIRERTSTNDNLFATGNSPLLTSNYEDFTFQFLDNTTYSGLFKLELLAGNQVKITTEIGGNVHSITDTASAFTTFNAFGFFVVNDSSSAPHQASLDFTQLSVSAVPEPMISYLALGGLAVVLAGIPRRRCGSRAIQEGAQPHSLA